MSSFDKVNSYYKYKMAGGGKVQVKEAMAVVLVDVQQLLPFLFYL